MNWPVSSPRLWNYDLTALYKLATTNNHTQIAMSLSVWDKPLSVAGKKFQEAGLDKQNALGSRQALSDFGTMSLLSSEELMTFNDLSRSFQLLFSARQQSGEPGYCFNWRLSVCVCVCVRATTKKLLIRNWWYMLWVILMLTLTFDLGSWNWRQRA